MINEDVKCDKSNNITRIHFVRIYLIWFRKILYFILSCILYRKHNRIMRDAIIRSQSIYRTSCCELNEWAVSPTKLISIRRFAVWQYHIDCHIIHLPENGGRSLQTIARSKISMVPLIADLITSVNYTKIAAARASLLTRQSTHNCATISRLMCALAELNWN